MGAADGISYVFTYPFWLFVDTTKVLTVREIKIGAASFRIYPPFRSGPANFIPMPEVNPHAIPWLPGAAPTLTPGYRIQALAIFPDFDVDVKSSLRSVWGGDWGENPPRTMPMDSIRLDVYGDSENALSRLTGEVHYRLLQTLRWQTNQWWIGRSVDSLSGFLRTSFSVSSAGAPSEMPVMRGQGHTGRGDERPIDHAIWGTAIRHVEMRDDAPGYALLLFDARYFRAVGDIRRFVLDAAVACEQAKNMTYERLWRARGAKGRIPSSVAPGDDLVEDLSTKLEKFTNGTSYQRQHEERFRTLSNLWRNLRGNVAHGVRTDLDADPLLADSGNRALADAIVEDVDHCIRWLEGI